MKKLNNLIIISSFESYPDYGLNNSDLDNINVGKKRRASNANLDRVLLTIKDQPLDISIEKINQTLRSYKAKNINYSSWLEVGMALYNQFEGAKQGAQIWFDWSKLNTRYTEEHIKDKINSQWRTFKQSANSTRFSTIIHEAKASTAQQTICRKISKIYRMIEGLTPRYQAGNITALLKSIRSIHTSNNNDPAPWLEDIAAKTGIPLNLIRDCYATVTSAR